MLYSLSLLRALGSYSFPRRILHSVRSSASCFKSQYLLFSLMSSKSCLRLLAHLPLLSIFPSVTCFNSCRKSCDQTSQPSFVFSYVGCSFLPSLHVILLHFCARSVQLIFSIRLRHHISGRLYVDYTGPNDNHVHLDGRNRLKP